MAQDVRAQSLYCGRFLGAGGGRDVGLVFEFPNNEGLQPAKVVSIDDH